jgi:hypothetical protein
MIMTWFFAHANFNPSVVQGMLAQLFLERGLSLYYSDLGCPFYQASFVSCERLLVRDWQEMKLRLD